MKVSISAAEQYPRSFRATEELCGPELKEMTESSKPQPSLALGSSFNSLID